MENPIISMIWIALTLVAGICVMMVSSPGNRYHVKLGKNTDDGRQLMTDASGYSYPVKAYRRIIAASSVSRDITMRIAEPGTIIAVSDYGLASEFDVSLFAPIKKIKGLQNIEEILSLKPDLVLGHSFGEMMTILRLRDQGITIFDLGSLTGIESFLQDIRQVGTLIGRPEKAAHEAQTFINRINQVATDIGSSQKKTAIFLSIFGTNLYGGSKGTTYHDIISRSGLIDAASSRYSQWLTYRYEEVIALNPLYMITQDGMGSRLCQHFALARLTACLHEGHMIELPSHLFNDPGYGMLLAAESVRVAVYGNPPYRP